jgi:hypothetical protein
MHDKINVTMARKRFLQEEGQISEKEYLIFRFSTTCSSK